MDDPNPLMETIAWNSSAEKLFVIISQNSQKSTFPKSSFLNIVIGYITVPLLM